MPNYKTCFRNRLKELREDHNETQKSLSEKIQVSERTLNNWELKSRESIPSMDSLIDLSKFFGVSIDYLLGLNDCRTFEHEYIHNDTGLSENAIAEIETIKDDSIGEYGTIPTSIDLLSEILCDKDFTEILHDLRSSIGSEQIALDSMQTFPDNRVLKNTFETVRNSNIYHLSRVFSNILEHILDKHLSDTNSDINLDINSDINK